MSKNFREGFQSIFTKFLALLLCFIHSIENCCKCFRSVKNDGTDTINQHDKRPSYSFSANTYTTNIITNNANVKHLYSTP